MSYESPTVSRVRYEKGPRASEWPKAPLSASVEVPAAVVRAWIQRGVIPRARHREATSRLPSGLSLDGMEEWVSGLRSTDRLVAVDGSSVEEQKDVVRLLLEGLGRGQGAISGTWVRQEGQELRRVQVTFRLPLIREPHPGEGVP